MKYIVIKDSDGLQHPVIFSELLHHSEIKRAIESTFSQFKAVSAGKVSFSGVSKIAIPGSQSMAIPYTDKAMVEDTELLREHFNFNI